MYKLLVDGINARVQFKDLKSINDYILKLDKPFKKAVAYNEENKRVMVVRNKDGKLISRTYIQSMHLEFSLRQECKKLSRGYYGNVRLFSNGGIAYLSINGEIAYSDVLNPSNKLYPRVVNVLKLTKELKKPIDSIEFHSHMLDFGDTYLTHSLEEKGSVNLKME